MARHVMTPARKTALRKAQLASARKRARGGGARAKSYYSRHRRGVHAAGIAVGIGAVAVGVGMGMSGHKSRAVHGTKISAKVNVGATHRVSVPASRRPMSGTYLEQHQRRIRGYHPPRVYDDNRDYAIVMGYRQKKPVIGTVRTAKSATPRVHMGTVKYKTITQGPHTGEIHVTKGYNR